MVKVTYRRSRSGVQMFSVERSSGSEASKALPGNGSDAQQNSLSVVEGFARRLGKPSELASQTEIAAVRPLVQEDLVAGSSEPVLIKTHNALARFEGHPTINFDITLAAVYIVRNPLDVAISYAHYSGRTLDDTIAFMAEPGANINTSEKRVYEYMGSWSFHVASWLAVPDRPVLVLRYEDMLAAPQRAFARLAAFLGINASATQIERAVAASSFQELARQEAEGGFIERPPRAERFFRSGTSGQWRERLSPAQAAAIATAHGPMMQRFGYMQEACGSRLHWQRGQ